MGIEVIHGDCVAVLPTLAEASVDSVVTDPPYHLTSGNVSVDWGSMPNRSAAHGGGPKGPTNRTGRGHKTGFMGRTWDGGDVAFRPETWREVLRVMKPGAHLAACGGTRTFQRMACAIEDAGFERPFHIPSFAKALDPTKGCCPRAAWSPRSASWLLLRLLIAAFARTEPVVLGIDDTIERRRANGSPRRGSIVIRYAPRTVISSRPADCGGWTSCPDNRNLQRPAAPSINGGVQIRRSEKIHSFSRTP
jgi:hypothetical protein